MGVSGTNCPETKYSQADLNDHSPSSAPTNGLPWITTLIYQSITDPNGYYLAFEDEPMCTASWHGCNSGSRNPGEPQRQRRRLQRLRLLCQRHRLRGRRAGLRQRDVRHLRRRHHPVLERRHEHQVPAGHPGAPRDLQPPRRRLRRRHRQPGRARPLSDGAGLQPRASASAPVRPPSFPAGRPPSATAPTGSARTRRAWTPTAPRIRSAIGASASAAATASSVRPVRSAGSETASIPARGSPAATARSARGAPAWRPAVVATAPTERSARPRRHPIRRRAPASTKDATR